MAQPDPNYVTSPRPVNLRTAQKSTLPTPLTHPKVHERLSARQARNRLGAPLADQLRSAGTAGLRRPLSSWVILGGVVSAVAAVTLLLAWIQQSWPVALAGLVGLSAGLALILREHRHSAHATPGLPLPVPLLDEASLQVFDHALALAAAEVPEAVAAQLAALKQQIGRIARQASTTAVDEYFTLEDRLYLSECVRRYLPDSLQSFLSVPRAQRDAAVLDQGQTAVSLLASQLDLLKFELEKRETRLTQNAAGQLLKQQRFLESKARH